MIKVFGGGGWVKDSVSSSFEDADLVIMPGGGDWNPALYGQKPNTHTSWFSDDRDAQQMSIIKDAIKRNKIVFGICRGLQGVTIANGGTLVQHVSHPGSHPAHFKNGEVLMTNSIHHQLCNPYNLSAEDYEVLAWTEGLSPVHIGEHDQTVVFPEHAYEQGILKEPEVIWYPKTRCIGAQSHPEMMHGRPFQDKMNQYIWDLFTNNTINATDLSRKG